MLFLIALVAYFFYFATAIIYYYRYPVSTSVEYKLESSLDFPSVTICNYNIIRKSFIDSFNDSTGQLVLDIINPYDKANVDYSSDDFEDEIYDASEYIDMREFGEKGKHHREDMFMGCDFMSANYSYDPCQFNDELLVTKVTQMGYCYTFHPQSYIEKYGALVSTRPGQAGGLHLQIDLRQDEYTSGAEGSAAGMRVCHRYLFKMFAGWFLQITMLICIYLIIPEEKKLSLIYDCFYFLTLKVLTFWNSFWNRVGGSLDSYCSLKPLWSGMGEVVPARTSPTLHPPSPPTVLSLSC